MSKRLIKTIFGVILLLTFVLRFHQLADNPRILNRDEAALAFNAYLINEVGQDEWQEKYPLVFKSFGDYKLPGYVYLLAILFRLFEPNDWLVRAPSALAGVGIVVMMYLIGKELFHSPSKALTLMLFSALCPVLLFYSRMAWEANLALLLLLVSLWLLIFSCPVFAGQWKKDILGLVFYLLAILTYNTPLLLSPLIMGVLVIKRGVKRWRDWLLPLVGLSLIMIIGLFILGKVTVQKSSITIFSDPTTWQQYVQYRESLPEFSKKIFGNRYWYWLSLLLKHFFASFSAKFLVIKGGTHPWHAIEGSAHLYWTLYLLGLLGLGQSLVNLLRDMIKQRKKILKHQDWLLVSMLFGSLLPAIVTTDAPHATRSLLFLLMFLLMAIKGFELVLAICKKQKVTWIVVYLLIGLETSIYVNRYFYQFPYHQQALKPGFDELIIMANQRIDSSYFEVEADGYQYILQAWYQRLSPNIFYQSIKRVGPDPVGIYRVEHLDKFAYVYELESNASNAVQVYWSDQKSMWMIKERH